MARYRKVDPKIWNDSKFRKLTDSGKLCFLFILTHPHMTSLGAMRASIPGLAAELGWKEKAFAEAFREACPEALPEGCFGGMVFHDPVASFIGLPNFLKFNPPESPNVVKSWREQWDMIPECAMKDELYHRVKAFLKAFGEGFHEAYAKTMPKAMPKTMPNPEPEPEPEPEQEHEPNTVTPKAPEKDGIPVDLDTADFRDAWSDWQTHRKEIHHPLKPTGQRQALADLSKLGPARAVAAIRFSIGKGWQGIFEETKNGRGNKQMPCGPGQSYTPGAEVTPI